MNKIHPTAIIGDNTKIGKGTEIGVFCVIGSNVVIGDNVNMKAFCEIRDDCIIEDNVSFGSRCTLAANTLVEKGVVIKYGFVATDTPKIGEIARQPCTLKKGSRFGANVTIMPGVTIGENSEIGACSQVRHNVPSNEIWYGNPASLYKKKN